MMGYTVLDAEGHPIGGGRNARDVVDLAVQYRRCHPGAACYVAAATDGRVAFISAITGTGSWAPPAVPAPPAKPAKRIGTVERLATVDALSDHYAAGRLTDAEFGERSARALAAVAQPDLDALTGDLPGLPKPQLPEPPPRRVLRSSAVPWLTWLSFTGILVTLVLAVARG